MKTMHSLSGGKTSSYMAIHYPADINIFSLIKLDNILCSPKDKFLIKKVSDKLGEQFIATAEDDKTLIAMFDLEQKLGKEIYWVSGFSFDYIIKNKGGYLPSSLRRYCTTEMKIRPIFDWWFNNIGEKVKMGIGYRYDEKERADKFSNTFKGIVGKRGTQNKWENVEWREGWFPLIENKITHPRIYNWANESGIIFPHDSNCVGCFHKPKQQLRKNWQDNKEKMQWFANAEKIGKGTWKDDKVTYEQIKKFGLQESFYFGTGSGCDGGFCTD